MTSPVQASGWLAGRLRAEDGRALRWGAIALAVMLGYASVVRPALADLTRKRETLADERALLTREQALIASMQRLPQLRTGLQQQLAAASSRLFSGDSVAATAELASYVATLANASLVRLTSVEAGAPESAQGITSSEVDVRGEASWRNALAFVHTLETGSRLVDVRALRMERGPRGGPLGGDLVLFTATLAGYSRGAP